MNPHAVLESLLTQEHTRTADLPRDQRGIYGLVDHTGIVRYIGSTSEPAENFRKRIHQRHRTGSETNSHYFSNKYNCGRMWRDRRPSRAIRTRRSPRICGRPLSPSTAGRSTCPSKATSAPSRRPRPRPSSFAARERALKSESLARLPGADGTGRRSRGEARADAGPKGSDRAPGKVASKRNNKRLMLGPA